MNSGVNLAIVLQKAMAAHNGGDLRAAEQGYVAVLRAQPNQFDALHLLGALKLQQGTRAKSTQ